MDMSEFILLYYFDYVVIILVDLCVIEVMMVCFGFDGIFGNFVFSLYVVGWFVKDKVEYVCV